MKKIMIFLTAMLLFVGATFAQQIKTMENVIVPAKKHMGTITAPVKLEQNVVTDQPTKQMKAALLLLDEGFETPTFPPAGWISVNADGDAYNWKRVSSTSNPSNAVHSGSYAACSDSWIGGTVLHPDNWLITPQIAIPEGGALLKFWIGAQDQGYYWENYSVLVSTTNTELTSFTTIHTEVVHADPNYYYEVSLSLAAYAGQDIYVAFRHHDISDVFQLLLDDVSISTVSNDPSISIENPIAFGTVYYNAPEISKQVTISNEGAQTLTVALASASAEIAVKGFPITIPAFSDADITVTLDAAALYPGDYNGNIVLNTNDPENLTLTVDVTATVGLGAFLPYLKEDFNAGVWPTGWLQAGGFSIQTTGGVGNSGCVRSNLWSSNTQGALQTPLFFMGSDPELTFKYQVLNYTGGAPSANGALIYAVFISTDFGATFTNIHQGTHVSSADFVTITADVSAYVNQIALVQLGFFWQSGDYYLRVDDVNMGTEPQKDLGISFTGPLTPMATYSHDYSITVKNSGLVTADNYVVTILSEDDEILATESVSTPLVPNATSTFTFPFTFPQSQAGIFKMKAVVTYEDDDFLLNNEAKLTLDIIPHPGYYEDNCLEAIIGTATTTVTNIPVCYLWENSYSQQIYLASELSAQGINAGDNFTSIAFQYAGSSTYTLTNQTVYLGNTTQSEFTGTTATSWVPYSNLQQPAVYSGNITYAPGWVTINFTTPFVYTGGNIVVAVNNAHGDWSTSLTFNGTTTTPNYRAMMVRQDGTPYNPANPPNATERQYNRPNIKFDGGCEKYYTLNPNDIYGSGAIVTLDPPEGIIHGTDGTVYFDTDNDCTAIVDVIIDGFGSQGPISSWFFENVTEPLPKIEVITYIPSYDITVTYDENLGEITLNGEPVASGVAIEVSCGTNQTFLITPEIEYAIASITDNGDDQPLTTNKPYKPYNYYITYIQGNHDIQVEFMDYPQRYITYVVDGVGGTVAVDGDTLTSGVVRVDMGDTFQEIFTFIPDAHYLLDAVTIDGVLNMFATLNGYYMFTGPITTDHEIIVKFKPETYTITATSGANGTISPAGNIVLPYGAAQRFYFYPMNEGFVVDQVFVDNNLDDKGAAEDGYYDFDFVDANRTIHVTFKAATLHIYATSGDGGSIDPIGVVPVQYNEIKRFTFVPEVENGYKISMVYVDGQPYPEAIPTGSYTFYYITTNHTIHVTYEKITYPVIAAIDAHGAITDEGTTYVDHGDNITYHITTIPGYEFVNVFIDGKNDMAALNFVNSTGTYTFTNVTAPHAISVVTALQKHTITAFVKDGEGGSITPSGAISVTHGETQVFAITPLIGYEIVKVMVDNVENIGALLNGSYSFVNVTTDHTIIVEFGKMKYRIEAAVTGNGFITPVGITEVEYGDEITYEMTAAEGYQISQVLVNGDNMGAINTYTFAAIEADGNIEVFFNPMDPTGITDPINGISVYSHTNIVYIVNSAKVDIQDVSIFDMYGRIVWQGKVYNENNEIPLNVANGIYTVRIATDENFTSTKISIHQ